MWNLLKMKAQLKMNKYKDVSKIPQLTKNNNPFFTLGFNFSISNQILEWRKIIIKNSNILKKKLVTDNL